MVPRRMISPMCSDGTKTDFQSICKGVLLMDGRVYLSGEIGSPLPTVFKVKEDIMKKSFLSMIVLVILALLLLSAGVSRGSEGHSAPQPACFVQDDCRP